VSESLKENNLDCFGVERPLLTMAVCAMKLNMHVFLMYIICFQFCIKCEHDYWHLCKL